MKYSYFKNGKLHETEPSPISDLGRYNELLQRNTFWIKMLVVVIGYGLIFVTALVFWIAWKDILTRTVHILAG